ncbi:hypothetical protein D3C87_1466130 [compost metagenome]
MEMRLRLQAVFTKARLELCLNKWNLGRTTRQTHKIDLVCRNTRCLKAGVERRKDLAFGF